MPYEVVNKLSELERELRRMREDADIWDLLSEHLLPFGHEQHLRAIVASLEERTPYLEIVEAIASSDPPALGEAVPVAPRHHRLVDLVDDRWRKRYVLTSCACLSQAVELYSLGTRASPEVRPVLLADSARLVLAFLVRSVTRVDAVPPDLGLSVEIDAADPSSAELEVSPEGFTSALATTLAVIERPSAFTPVIPDLETARSDSWVAYGQRTGLSLHRPVRVPIRELVTYDFETDARSQTMRWMLEGFHARYLATSALLRDLLLVGAASEVARREPAVWRDLLRGESTDLGRHIDRAQGGLREMVRTVAEVLMAAEAGEKSAYVATGYHFV